MKAQPGHIYLSRLLEIIGVETIGHMFTIKDKDIVSINSLELPWLNNRKNVSCILPGTYKWVKAYSEKHKMVVIKILDVPGRNNIEIHIANYARELLGCIGTALNTKDIDHDGVVDVSQSRNAFERLMEILPDTGFIHITDNLLTRV